MVLHNVVPTGDLSKEGCAQFWCPLQRPVINVDKSEPRPVASRPLEIVHRTPMEIASHRHSFGGSALQLRKIVAQEHDPVAVVNETISGWLVRSAATVLGDVDFLDVPELH